MRGEAYGEIDSTVVHDCAESKGQSIALVRDADQTAVLADGLGLPLILYSPLSWLLVVLTLSEDDALEPTVSCFSKPGWDGAWAFGCAFSSCEERVVAPGRRAKGLRMEGMVEARRAGVPERLSAWSNLEFQAVLRRTGSRRRLRIGFRVEEEKLTEVFGAAVEFRG